jgi:hypothetical protein
MKKTIPILTTFALIAAALATTPCRAQKPEDKTIGDFDRDRARDTVWFDRSRSVIVCRLSSHDFRPIESLPLEVPSEENSVRVRSYDVLFYFYVQGEKMSYASLFIYDDDIKKIRLESISCHEPEYENISGDANIELTGEYEGIWYRADDGEMVAILQIFATMPFHGVALEDFSDGVYTAFGERSRELFETHKGKIEPGVLPIVLKDGHCLLRRPIPAEDYNARKSATAHLRKPLEMITAVDDPGWSIWKDENQEHSLLSNQFRETAVTTDAIEKMLGGRLKFIDAHGYEYEGRKYHYHSYEITFNDGTRKQIAPGEHLFVAYFPQLEAITFYGDGGDEVIELNDSGTKLYGNELLPLLCAVSPDKRWRINGRSPDNIAYEDYGYYLERWNPAKKIYEYVGNIFGVGRVDFCAEWSWVDNDTVLYMGKWDDGDSTYGEITITEKP